MRATILKLLGFDRAEAEGDQPVASSIRQIVDALEKLEPERARYIAAFSYLLSRVAHADLEITADETAAMERIVIEHAALPEEQAILAVQIAKTQARLFGGTENFIVAREFAEISDREQKLALIDCLFAVSAADGSISSDENNEVARIATQMKLPRADLNEIRSRYRNALGFLKPSD